MGNYILPCVFIHYVLHYIVFYDEMRSYDVSCATQHKFTNQKSFDNALTMGIEKQFV